MAPPFDPDSVTPLYEQAADYVAGLVASGTLEPGQKLAAERDLADQWGIGYQTVRRAMRELRERGLVVSRVGKGTFIAGKPEAPALAAANGLASVHDPPSSGLRHGIRARYQGSLSLVSAPTTFNPALPRGSLLPCLRAAAPAR